MLDRIMELNSTMSHSRARVSRTPNLLQIAMPMGGIGTGCVCLNGIGGIQDFSIYGKPATSATQDVWDSNEAAFAVLHIHGDGGTTRLVEGPFPVERIYDQGNQGQGYRKGGFEGMPRFRECTCYGTFPFSTVQLDDPSVPLQVEVTGWNPFIPQDDLNSGIPCAILEYTLRNPTDKTVIFDLCFSISHLAPGSKGESGTRNSILGGHGLFLYNSDDDNGPKSGSVSLTTPVQNPRIKAMWFRGGWFDSISALWREISTEAFRENDGSLSETELSGRNGGSVMVTATLAPGEQTTIPFILAWHFPNSDLSVGALEDHQPEWHPFYATQWPDAGAVAHYVLQNLESLRSRSLAFQSAVYDSNWPDELLDAVASNLAIIKSSTVLRESSGGLWGWEGCFPGAGCCHGSCTHVWNYAQSIPHLFPTLERSLREQEYRCSMDDRGHVNFRSALPAGPTSHDYHAAADGQLGGIMKLYRDWQICGDQEWLEQMYPLAKRSLDFGISGWDPKQKGALFEPHHNTYDIEFWGPDGMCTTIYLGALCAMAEMAEAVGKPDDSAFYRTIAERSAEYLDAELFNGEYYYQKVKWVGLRDTSFLQMLQTLTDSSEDDEMAALLKREGPKYQYGTGCISDGVIGSWMAQVYGIQTGISIDNVKSHLKSIYRHNFKKNLFDHACLQRPGYALGHEAGLLLCTWPQGGMPTLPFVYSDEVWTGIEYQVASHMIALGMVNEGLAIVKAVRARYDGHVRNPYNEYECGNYYARAMASYALVGAYSGFRYSAVTKILRLNPKTDTRPYKTFFSVASGFGTIELQPGSVTVDCVEGELELLELKITNAGKIRVLQGDWTVRTGVPLSLTV